MSPDRFRKAIALDRAHGVTLWQVILAGDALRETQVLFTADPVRICEAFWRGNMDAPRWQQRGLADLRTLPVPPEPEDMDEEEAVLEVVRALPRDRFFTTSELAARGVGASLVACENAMLARHLSMSASEARGVPMRGARLDTAARDVLLRDLAAISRRLSANELHVLLTVAMHGRVGQTTTTARRTE
jgi:hypothetical protein